MAKTRIAGQDIGDGLITDADIATTNKDGATGTPSLRTLGTGALQAAAGSHTHGGGSAAVYAPGSTTLADGQFAIFTRRLVLTTTQRYTLQGTARLRIT